MSPGGGGVGEVFLPSLKLLHSGQLQAHLGLFLMKSVGTEKSPRPDELGNPERGGSATHFLGFGS